MAFTITAELPLGTYRGATSDGQQEIMPSVARLYSALLCAAGFGPRARSGAGSGPIALLGPCQPDEVALRWLESNPPDAISVPPLEVNRGRTTAYREDGTILSSKGAVSFKKLGKTPDSSVAVNGAFRWTWTCTPPAEVVASLVALCPDVPHLGTSEAPVRLTTHEVVDEGTHVLDLNAGLFTGGGEDVELPLAGRLAELRVAHQAATTAVPSIAKDRWKTNESARAPAAPREAVALARYRPVTADGSDDLSVPWTQVLLLPLAVPVPERERLRLAVATHRALIAAAAALGGGVPPLLTGAYPEDGGTRPANRLAIQVLDSSMPVDLHGAVSALALLVPRGTPAGDLQVLGAAVDATPSVRGPRGRLYRVDSTVRSVAGAQFWRPGPTGMLRTWRTSPPALPDTRGTSDASWTFAHAALLSLGYVWRDDLPRPTGRGDQRQRSVVDAVNAAGVAVLQVNPVRDSDLRPWFHKVNAHAVVRPYRAELWLGDLCSSRTLQAIGQSRHLGGGLLVPVDRPRGTASPNGVPRPEEGSR